MIGWSSYVMFRIMVANTGNVHYYERYVNLAYSLGGKSWLAEISNLECVS